jgi:hypothetical protein
MPKDPKKAFQDVIARGSDVEVVEALKKLIENLAGDWRMSLLSMGFLPRPDSKNALNTYQRISAAIESCPSSFEMNLDELRRSISDLQLFGGLFGKTSEALEANSFGKERLDHQLWRLASHIEDQYVRVTQSLFEVTKEKVQITNVDMVSAQVVDPETGQSHSHQDVVESQTECFELRVMTS